LAAIYGQCDGQGLTNITRVCFNPFWINPTIPVTGEQQQQQQMLGAAVGGRLASAVLKPTKVVAGMQLLVCLDMRCWQGQQQQQHAHSVP
jgi:hypothetical protein